MCLGGTHRASRLVSLLGVKAALQELASYPGGVASGSVTEFSGKKITFPSAETVFGTLLLPADDLIAGYQFRMVGEFVMGTAPPPLTINFRIGRGAVSDPLLGTSGRFTPARKSYTGKWWAEGFVYFTSTGPSGRCQAGGLFSDDIETAGTVAGEMSRAHPMGSRDSAADTTSGLVLSVAIATSAAAGCSVSALAGSAESLG